jgi:hypothetical protein
MLSRQTGSQAVVVSISASTEATPMSSKAMTKNRRHMPLPLIRESVTAARSAKSASPLRIAF